MNSTNVRKKITNIAMAIAAIALLPIVAGFVYSLVKGGMFAAQPFGGAMFLDSVTIIALAWILDRGFRQA